MTAETMQGSLLPQYTLWSQRTHVSRTSTLVVPTQCSFISKQEFTVNQDDFLQPLQKSKGQVSWIRMNRIILAPEQFARLDLLNRA